MKRFTRAVIIFLQLVTAGMVAASPVCNVAKENWMSEPDLKRALKRQGYLVKTVRINNGCYEIYGLDPLGRRILKYFDPATGKPVPDPSHPGEIPA